MLTRLVLVALSIATAAPIQAQVDLAKALVGTWQGEVDMQGLPANPGRDPRRTLVVDSVSQRDGKWVGIGRFGITGQPLGPVDIAVDTGSAKPSLRFTNLVGVTVKLNLVADNQLNGTFQASGTAARSTERPMRLDRKP